MKRKGRLFKALDLIESCTEENVETTSTSSYLEALGHRLSEPDMLLLAGVLAEVPVLQRNAATAWVDAGLTSLHVAEDLDGIQRRALVGVHPVGAYRNSTLGKE